MEIAKKHMETLADVAQDVTGFSESLINWPITDDALFALGGKLISLGKQCTELSGIGTLATEPKHILLVKDAALLNAFKQVLKEHERAVAKFPVWPDNMVMRAAIVAEEAGELIQAANNYYWNDANKELFPMHQEAMQTAVTAIRMMVGLAAEIKEGGANG